MDWASPWVFLRLADETQDQGDDGDDQEADEENLRNPHTRARDATKTEDGRDEGEDEEDDCPFDEWFHDDLCRCDLRATCHLDTVCQLGTSGLLCIGRDVVDGHDAPTGFHHVVYVAAGESGVGRAAGPL